MMNLQYIFLYFLNLLDFALGFAFTYSMLCRHNQVEGEIEISGCEALSEGVRKVSY